MRIVHKEYVKPDYPCNYDFNYFWDRQGEMSEDEQLSFWKWADKNYGGLFTMNLTQRIEITCLWYRLKRYYTRLNNLYLHPGMLK